MYDIVIVGGGPAGMTAAIYGLRAGKKVIIIEGTAFGGQITLSPHVENYPGIAGMNGNEFSSAMAEQVTTLGAEMEYARVTGIRDNKSTKTVITEGREIEGKTVILAAGATHRKLGLPREEELTGWGVSYCAVCDGAFFKGMDVAVVGGGSAALQDAAFLSECCRTVSVIHRRDEFRGEPMLVEKLKEKNNVKFILDSIVTELLGSDALEGIKIKNKKTEEESEIKLDGLFAAIGQTPRNDIFGDVVKLNEYGYILSSEDCMTNVPGIFAAGDCRTKEVRQLTTATADGTVAALKACEFIR